MREHETRHFTLARQELRRKRHLPDLLEDTGSYSSTRELATALGMQRTGVQEYPNATNGEAASRPQDLDVEKDAEGAGNPTHDTQHDEES